MDWYPILGRSRNALSHFVLSKPGYDSAWWATWLVCRIYRHLSCVCIMVPVIKHQYSLRRWRDSGAGGRAAEPPYLLAKLAREFTSGEAASDTSFTNPLTAWPLVFTASLPKQKHSRAKSRQLRRLTSVISRAFILVSWYRSCSYFQNYLSLERLDFNVFFVLTFFFQVS